MKIAQTRILFLFIIFFISISNQAFSKIEIILGNTSLEGNVNIAQNIPTTDEGEIIISREQYVISYNKLRRSPNWVAWKLEANQIGNSGRSNNFSIDLELENYLKQNPENLHAVNNNEFKGSCFDRGHQIPSADRTDSVENNKTTFAMSNMIPQTPYLNRVIWGQLEQYTRNLVQKKNKKAYIIAGSIYDQDFGTIGPNHDIPVPSKSFKVIVIQNSNQAIEEITDETQIISVVMPNTLQNGTNPRDNRLELCKTLSPGSINKTEWEKYKTTVAQIEKLSGFNFLLRKNMAQ